MPAVQLEWEITSHEAKSRALQMIPAAARVLVIFAAIMAWQARSWKILLVFAGIMIIFYLLTATLGKFKGKTYKINEVGIFVSKGNKQKTYSWNDFECFYTHTLVAPNRKYYKDTKDFIEKGGSADLVAMQEQFDAIGGSVYYLQKKKVSFLDKFRKVFVVIYSEPDNSKEVAEALKVYLPHEIMEPFTDAGMVKYEFR
jgi:hypothetical protein